VKILFCTEDPAKIGNVTTMPRVYRKTLRKRLGLAMWPLAMGAA
jgi:hypothetical protein